MKRKWAKELDNDKRGYLKEQEGRPFKLQMMESPSLTANIA